MEPYERLLDSAQKALKRRDQARDELEYMLHEDDERDPEVKLPRDPPGKRIEPETWPRLPV